MKETALVVGATGLVGMELTKQLLDRDEIGLVKIVVRRAFPLEHPKLEVLLLDWKEVDQWGEEISANQVFCCLGTTHKKAGSMAAFRAVDVDLVVAVGRRAQLWCRSFTVVSSQGANPLSMWPYLKAKGDMEMGLRRLGLERLNIVRPGLLLGQRAESRPAERLAMRIMKSMMGILRGRLRFLRPVSDHKLAKFMIHIAAAPEKGIYHYENQDIN
ncbi:MAG: NAD(P)H-binding protein [Bacteroidia bacterium]|jgi:uncharacterized protein YbjT (DUF2867 family)